MSQTDILIRAVNPANCLAAVALIIIGDPHKRVEGNLHPEKMNLPSFLGQSLYEQGGRQKLNCLK